jgi:transcriptional regulator with XRE-family HTH domain
MARDALQFGRLLRNWRLLRNYGQREFAELVDEYASNLAAIESGHRQPWTDMRKLRKAAECLALVEGSNDWNEFFSFAANSKASDLDEYLERDEVVALLRTVRDRKLTEKEIMLLTDYAKTLQGKQGIKDVSANPEH